MIGLFDSGNGGLTVFRALRARFPQVRFIYLGDHANTPYGNRPSEEIVAFTQAGVELLFERGCRLVLLACNTATAVACRALQQDWLPSSAWQGHNILGIIAPTVEAATQTPWAITSPQYPQKNNSDLIAIFATRRTVATNVYPEEIAKRCPRAKIIQQACPKLAGAIEEGVPPDRIDAMIQEYVGELMDEDGFFLFPYHLEKLLVSRGIDHESRLVLRGKTVDAAFAWVAFSANGFDAAVVEPLREAMPADSRP